MTGLRSTLRLLVTRLLVDRIAYIQFPKADEHGNHDHSHEHPSNTKDTAEDDSAPGSAIKGNTIERIGTKKTLRKPSGLGDAVEGDSAPDDVGDAVEDPA